MNMGGRRNYSDAITFVEFEPSVYSASTPQSLLEMFFGAFLFPASLLKLYLHLTQKRQRASTVVRDEWDAGPLSTESEATSRRVIQLHHCSDETTVDEMDLSCFSVLTWWKFIRCARHVCCTLAGALVKGMAAGFHRNLLNLLRVPGQSMKTSAAWMC